MDVSNFITDIDIPVYLVLMEMVGKKRYQDEEIGNTSFYFQPPEDHMKWYHFSYLDNGIYQSPKLKPFLN